MSAVLRAGVLLGTAGLLVAIAVVLTLQAHGPASGAPAEEEIEEQVLFLTNRAEAVGRREVPPGERYGGRRGTPRYGRCAVRFSPIPMANGLAERVEFFVPTEIRNVHAVDELEGADFFEAMEARLAPQGGGGPIVLFVHGYAYGFARTCRMGAELQRMLGNQAAVVMFSWPSDANPVDYVADQVDVEWSVPDLAALLERLAQRFGSERVKILAHSIGTRGTLFALAQLRLSGREMAVADHLVLLAPDFDTATFTRQFPLIRSMVGRVTLYASDNDMLLPVSEALHGYPRLGQAGPALAVLPGMETVDVSPAGRYHPSGHEYFYYHPVVADDLAASLLDGGGGRGRDNRVRREKNGIAYWALTRSR